MIYDTMFKADTADCNDIAEVPLHALNILKRGQKLSRARIMVLFISEELVWLTQH